ncbi:MAG: site-specific DNA-methyltransferase [Chloroflexota bacterium]|nr:site-specific DNA-methyltransferase [Chloroflexota bacterium]MDQ5864696.1 site-specific DNA-methyltransferase [Chloroflexota bacterium]
MDVPQLHAKHKPYYTCRNGSAYLGDSLDLIKHLPDNHVQLILTSPPFALTSKKEYGNKSSDEYVEWFLEFAREFKRVLRDDGSFVVDLGGAYLPGHPVRSIYQFELLVRLCKELGFFLAQEFFHYNPARLPGPAEWTNVRRIRVKDSVNVVWWLSKTEYPKANNRNVLRPYTEAMKQLLQNGYRAKKRPSGHNITNKFSRENEGAIPPNLLELGNNDSNSVYMRKCNESGIKPHPARFPKQFAEFFVKFLTDENDLVLDPFAGSNTTGYVAELLERRWLAFELNESYLEGSRFRFDSNDDGSDDTSPEQDEDISAAREEIFQVSFITRDHVHADIIKTRVTE